MSGAVKHAYEIVQKVPQPTLTAESAVPSHSHYTPLARPQSVHNHYTVTPHRNVPLHTPARLNHKHDTGSSTCEGPQQSTRISQRMGAAGFRQLRRFRPEPRWSDRQEFDAYIGENTAHWCIGVLTFSYLAHSFSTCVMLSGRCNQ